MNRKRRGWGLPLLAGIAGICMLAGCSLFTGPKGEAGTEGREAAKVYLLVKTADSKATGADPAGTQLCSGGCCCLGTVTGSGNVSVSTVFSIINNSGHSITLQKSGSSYVSFTHSGYSNGALSQFVSCSSDETSLNASIADSAQSGNILTLSLTMNTSNSSYGGIQYFVIPYIDDVTKESDAICCSVYTVIQ